MVDQWPKKWRKSIVRSECILCGWMWWNWPRGDFSRRSIRVAYNSIFCKILVTESLKAVPNCSMLLVAKFGKSWLKCMDVFLLIDYSFKNSPDSLLPVLANVSQCYLKSFRLLHHLIICIRFHEYQVRVVNLLLLLLHFLWMDELSWYKWFVHKFCLTNARGMAEA